MLWLTALLEDSVSVGYTTDLPMSQPVMKAKRSNTQAMMSSCIGVRCSGFADLVPTRSSSACREPGCRLSIDIGVQEILVGEDYKSFGTLLAVLVATVATAQMSQPMVSESAGEISDHVWAIMGFPNIAIIVGAHSTLVVNTGLGPKNGATVARVVEKLAPGNRNYPDPDTLPSRARCRRAGLSSRYYPDTQPSAAAGNG